MIKFLQSQLVKTEERLNETIKVKKGLEGIIEFLKRRKKTQKDKGNNKVEKEAKKLKKMC